MQGGQVSDSELGALRRSVGWDHEDGAYDRVLLRSYAYFTARDLERLVGFVNVISDGVADAFLVDLLVHPDHQRRGIGTNLIKAAAVRVKSDGIQCLHVTFNPGIEDFYRKAGFHLFCGAIIDFKNMKA